MAIGRPTKYTNKLASKILGRIAMGDSLNKIVSDPDMPSHTTVYRWIVDMPDFRDSYTRAREDQAETLADQIIDIADTEPAISPLSGSVDSGAVQHQRLRVEARKWVAAKLKPKKYGDKITQEITADVKTEHSLDTSKLSNSALSELMELRRGA